MAGIRKDVATLGAGWNPALEWYAKAVHVLEQRELKDRTSWRYLGAIHGFDEDGWRARRIIRDGESLPPAAEWNGRMWSQCQHQGWYFLPWHRGYLAAFEAIVAKTIRDLGGPADWTLPYWNYLDTTNPDARRFPRAFLDPQLPDGTPNPLAKPPRGTATALQPSAFTSNEDISLEAMRKRRFTAAPRTREFGGAQTGFEQFAGPGSGALELNPHNLVHRMIGERVGYMADPDYAGLDPIFWLHHCNIDRLWAAWLTQSQNIQENGAAWRDGPFPRRFEMPDTDGNLAIFAPKDVLNGGRLVPTYDNLTKGTGLGGAAPAAMIAAGTGGAMPASLSSDSPPAATLVGANADPVTVLSQQVATVVPIAAEMAMVAAAPVEERVYLNLENIRGTMPSGMLDVYVSAKPTAGPDVKEHVEAVALFGLAKASKPTDGHGGNGISIAIDITEQARKLAHETGAAVDQLGVHLQQPEVDSAAPITVDRVSIYKQRVE